MKKILITLSLIATLNSGMFALKPIQELFFAIEDRDSKKVEEVIRKHKKVLKDVDAFKNTALHKATDPKIAKILIRKGVIDVNAQNSDGDTALHKAAESGNIPRVAILVKEGDAKTNIQNVRKKTPLDLFNEVVKSTTELLKAN